MTRTRGNGGKVAKADTTTGTGTDTDTDTGRAAVVGAEEGSGSVPAPGTDRRPDTDRQPSTDQGAGTGTDRGPAGTGESPAAAETAARVWRNLAAVVLERNERRKETAEALGMSFFRVKALRRIAAQPRRMSELAAALSSDRPYLTLVVDDLVKRGLVERNQHPTDRRCKIVSATPAGLEAAARANAILGTPPPALLALPPEDLAALDRIAAALAAGS